VGEDLDAEGGVRRMELFARFYAAVEAFPAPTIAVCVGNVVGAGAELAAGCDLRVGGDNLKLAVGGGEARGPRRPGAPDAARRPGPGQGARLHRPGRRADEAAALGLLHRTAPAAEAEAPRWPSRARSPRTRPRACGA
jgi:enoyl-CoA hydratase/carnithine racemase